MLQQLGPYEIQEEIGRGGMAIVYRAYQGNIDRDVAIKVITKSLAGDDHAVQRFQREARLIARLEHPHILPVYDFDGGHEPPYIVMRYLDSGTLKEVLKQGALPLTEIVFLLRQVGSALDYAHRQGIIHRDIKPSNILVDREGNAFVTDFGLARMVAVQPGEQITGTGAIMGTPDYMAPEQARAEGPIDHRADIYSLAVIIFQMLTGRLPFESDKPMALMLMHLQDEVPSVIGYNRQLPVALDPVLARALAKEPKERFDSAAELVVALTEAMGITLSSPTDLRQVTGDSLLLSRLKKGSSTKTFTQTGSDQNKNVTVLYANAAEYAEIVAEMHGSEATRRAIDALWQAAHKLIGEHGGLVVSQSENMLMALWGADTTREQDAEQAIRAALAIRATLLEQGSGFFDEEDDEPLPLNIAINTGLALLSARGDTGSYSASGATISLTNRLMQKADGAILITHNTYSQVRGIFFVEPDSPLKIRRSRSMVQVYRVQSAKPQAFRMNTRGVEGIETQIVGRDAELTTLQNAFLDALEEEETQVLTIVAEAGLGKSRLLYEFSNWAELRPEQFWIFRGRATPEMSNRPYALFRDFLSYRFEIRDSDNPAVIHQKLESGVAYQIGGNSSEIAHMLGHLAGFDFSGSPYIKGLLTDPQQLINRARQMFNRWIVQLCASDLVIIELEDLHHADEASLDLLSTLFNENEHLPLMLVGLARPEFFQRRPTWGSGQVFHTRLELKPLDKRNSRALVREILQKVDRVPKALRDLLVNRAEGNPYYLEELVKTLIDDRIILKDNEDHWRVEEARLDNLEVPATLVGLLQARLDGLLYPERLTLQRAAVVGRLFYDSALVAIDAGDNTQINDLPAILKRLAEKEFISVRETTAFEGSKEYIFDSQMLRDVLLSTLLRRQQKQYNEAVAHWLIAAGGRRIDEYSGLVADYFHKAGQERQAAHYWQTAGNKALTMSAFAQARQLFERALAALPEDDEAQLSLLLGLGEACYQLGEHVAARQALTPLLELSGEPEHALSRADALYWLSQVAAVEGHYSEAQEYVQQSLPLARAGQDKATLARVLYGLGDLNWRLSNFTEAEENLQESLALSREVGDTNMELYALNRLGSVAFGLEQWSEGMRRREATLARAQEVGNRERTAVALNNLAVGAHKQGDTEMAHYYFKQALPIVRETGQKQFLVAFLVNLAEISIQLGDIAPAKGYLQEALIMARRMGAIPSILYNTQVTGWLLIKRGQQARGLALLGLGLHHPAANSDVRLNVYEKLADAGLSADDPAVTTGLDAARSLDLDTVADELLAEWDKLGL